MVRFIVFLRAINVGGHSVASAKLQEALTGAGYQNVSVYKQSGNVILEADEADPREIKRKVESKLRDELGYDTVALVRTLLQLKAIINLQAFNGCEKEGASFLVTFLAQAPMELPFEMPITIPKSTVQLISMKGSEVFSVTHGGGEGGLPNPFLESKLKLKATTRNLNTIVGIVEKFSERETK